MSGSQPGGLLDAQPNFDPIARSYRWLEYLTLGSSLERCRSHFLARLSGRRHALVLGDGDGRFLARLLARNHHLQADAVDTSAVMLELLRSRCCTVNAGTRLAIHLSDALAFTQHGRPNTKYDLVVTHFFLDCLTQAQVDAIAHGLLPFLAPNAFWLVSDFRLPVGIMRWPATIVVRTLYAVFRVLTGLRTQHLPNHGAALTRVGMKRFAYRYSLGGLLFTELWNFS